jgi:predicted permease
VLLICCANVANLLLARSSDRRRELAMRSALGASQSRLVRQLMTEGLLLSVIAGLLGVALGWAALQWLLRLLPPHLARIQNVGLNWAVLGFVAAVSLGSLLFFGLVPSLESRKWDLIATLRQSGRGSDNSQRSGVRAALIVCEIAMGLMLVTGAGLMIRTLEKIQHVQPGFESESLLTFGVDLPGTRYRDDKARSNFVRKWEATLRAIPGVESVGAVSHLPLDDYSNWYSPYRPEGLTKEQAAAMLADYRCVTPGYFRAMGTRLLEGRSLDEHDRVSARKVVVVDDMLARAAWPGQNPVGKKLEAEFMTDGMFGSTWAEVIGVVEHVRDHALAKQLRGQIYIVYEQSARSRLSYIVRSSAAPTSLAATVREELRKLDPELAISKIRPMTAFVDQAKAPARFTALLSGLFAVLALLLAAIGIYGVVHYSVSRRMHEMGVRMALGAAKADVVRLVMREGLLLAVLGMAAGLAGSLLVSRALKSLIFGVSNFDPLTYAAALIVVPAAVLLGCWRPAAKAAGANPLDAIRAD